MKNLCGFIMFWVGFLSFFIGLAIGASAAKSIYHREAIEQGFAEYNSRTGEWQWKQKAE